MPRSCAPRLLIALLVAAGGVLPVVTQPFTAVAVAAPAPARLDDAVAQKIQIAGEAERIPVIVEGAFSSTSAGGSQRAEAAEGRVRGAGGRIVASSALLGATVAQLTPAQIRALANDPAVGRIHFDTEVKASAGVADTHPEGPTPIVFQQAIGAPDAWQAGITGRGVGVAVLDSGIDASNTTAFGGRVTARVDLVDPLHPAAGDPGGHGTHVAGIVAAGRGAPSPGIAPDANLISVRVLDEHGSSHLSTVIRGLEWVIAHKESLGIRVVVMALGAPAVVGYREDPLAAVAELAWHSGLVVLAAASNDGPGAGSIETPAIDPLVIAVGAADDNGTAGVGDDLLPAWSSVGPTPDGLAKPDVLAPGRKIVSVRVPGSTVDLASPTHVEGPTTIRFSGTSEAVAVAAGAAALLLQQRHDLEPDQTRALLLGGAHLLDGPTRAAQGAGELNVARSLAARTPHVEHSRSRPADGVLRALLSQLLALGLVRADGVDDRAEMDGHGAPVAFDTLRWDTLRWDTIRWDTIRWDTIRWDTIRWDTIRWDTIRWDTIRWDGVLWDGASFD